MCGSVPSSKRRVIARLYLVLGGLGSAVCALCVVAFLRFAVDAPNDIGLAVVLVVLGFAHTIPAAGLPAYVWLRAPRWSPPSWPASVHVAGGAAVAVVLLAGGLFLGTAFVGPALALSAAAVVASRLALLRRGWIVAWLVGSVLVVALDAFALTIAWDLWRRT